MLLISEPILSDSAVCAPSTRAACFQWSERSGKEVTGKRRNSKARLIGISAHLMSAPRSWSLGGRWDLGQLSLEAEWHSYLYRKTLFVY